MIEQRIARVLAFLVKEEGVDPAAVERAVISARDMPLGVSVTLDQPDDSASPMRRTWALDQAIRLAR